MSVIETKYEKVDSVKTEFITGTQPGWFTDRSNGGSVSYESVNGGRAVFSTGTAATDDSARIDSNPVTPDAFDALLVRFVFDLNAGAASVGDASIYLGLSEDGGSQGTANWVNHGGSTRQGVLRHADSGGPVQDDTREVYPQSPIVTEILWDTVEQEIIHRTQGAFGRMVDSTIPDPTLNYNASVFIQTKDTAADRILNLYELEIGYMEKHG